MLTSEALADRKWGPFPALRALLQEGRPADRHYGSLSISDNVFQWMQRTLEIAILTRESEGLLNPSTVDGGPGALRADLAHLQEQLRQAARLLLDEATALAAIEQRVGAKAAGAD